MNRKNSARIVIAAYGVPGIYAIETLLGQQYLPEEISLWSYEADTRNRCLVEFAKSLKIKSVTFDAKSKEAFDWISSVSPDALFSIHFRDLIPGRILKVPKFGCVNLHPSLLPDLKGCFSAPWAIINQMEFTGFTYHYMEKKFDTGRIVFQKKVKIDSTDTGYSLFHRLIVEGLKVFDEVVNKVLIEHDLGTLQPDGGSYYSRDVPYGGLIDLSWSRVQIEHFIRALYFPPFKGAVVRMGDEEIEVNSLEEFDSALENKNRKVAGVHS